MDKYSGEFNLKIRQVQFDEEFSHWEWEVYIGKEIISEGTSPDFFGCVDAAFEIFYPDVNHTPEDLIDMEFFKKDANKREE